ncbi:hypothetical protein OO007_06515 [Cocleimonas sp. KMM 6892]|uniref:hypothetical protein n=1 Tax=unclassified Cocleimonas TaxID=2639732 RepID=UPI002DB74432|nr:MULTISPECIES: hypothetical protein [unclassified Cocleimonas]MEB8431875.1 hypothetical protein [Cocleimonas sp. KMM 6892]MEC4715039.1 hypothetical protein [Cocleimonas sp. KMM 6895]MEC4744147.1 hypothetical protein [Cocleimonas sp. KMM 6896]
MAEIENPNFLKGHNLNLKQIRLDIYRLACYFEANKSFANQNVESNQDLCINRLPREFLEDEVSRILLQSAIIIRILDDESEADKEEKNPFYCGELLFKNSTQQLSLREACNKIVHGQQINFDIEELNGHSYLKPIVYLYGYQGKNDWKATLQIQQFVDHGARLLTARTLNEFLEWEGKYGST